MYSKHTNYSVPEFVFPAPEGNEFRKFVQTAILSAPFRDGVNRENEINNKTLQIA